jgi:hypothetical protein
VLGVDEEEEAVEADKVEQGDEPVEATQPPLLVAGEGAAH